MKTPFHLFSWNKPFLPRLKKFVARLSGDRPGRALIITPHLRPARYMTNLYRKDGQACILPKMLSINELVSRWRALLKDEPLRMANTLDQVAILHECIRDLDLNNPWATSMAANIDEMESFLPWGIRLAKLLEDFAIEGAEVTDFPEMSEELGASPAAILSSLREINTLWEATLAQRHWTTPGQDHKFVAAHANEIPHMFMPAPDRPVIIAGFYTLTKTHNRMLKSLWNVGAHVCLHSDSALMAGGEHWAASRHADWVQEWNASLEIMPAEEGEESEVEKTEFTFFAGYDLHSQLNEARSILQDQGRDGLTTAIVPCREDALLPLLQNLPPVNVNVSMGYPMERSSLIGLFSNILQMFANSPQEACWKSRDVLAVIRHPYLPMLKDAGNDGKTSYNASLHKLENKILAAGPFWRQEGDDDSPALGLISHLRKTFGGIDSLEKLGEAIENFCHWLLAKSQGSWRWKNPLDLEVMHRLVHDIVPVFRNNLLQNERFSSETLLDFFNELVKGEKIPFQAEPIEGLQVLGLLESRLLHFDRVLFLDATDEALPASSGQDPLLPDSLRFLAGLPDRRDREASAAHNLFRLLAGAKKAYFLWQEGVPAGEFYDSKRTRSRFVERLIWEQEKDNPDLLDERPGLVRRPQSSLNVKKGESQPIKRSPEFDAALARFWSESVPVTALDSYLKSPADFIMDWVMGLRGMDRVQNRNGLAGSFVHEVLKNLYKERENDQLLENLDAGQRKLLIDEAYKEASGHCRLTQVASLEDQVALSVTVPKILQSYFAQGTDRLRCLKVEEEVEGEIGITGRKLKFDGRIDRLDLGTDGLYVIDYKTGKPPVEKKDTVKFDPSFWEGADFFTDVRKACEDKDPEALNQCFEIMRGKVGSLQLPLYLLLLATQTEDKYGAFPANALWVYLRHKEKKKDLPLLASSLEGNNDPRLGHFVQAINLVYHHMLLMPNFVPETDKGL